MSAQEFKPGDRVRCIETWTTHVIDSGDEFTVEDVDPTTRNGLEVFVQGEWVPARYFEKVEPEFVVGQRVSHGDYGRLPVGSRVRNPNGTTLTKISDDGWTRDDGSSSRVHASETMAKSSFPARTLTHLGDGLADWERELLAEVDAEDKDDLHVEPEPLKEGDAVLVWAKVVDPEQDELGDFAIDVMYGATFDRTFARLDAIVRPRAGQVPPWVKPAEEPMGLGAVVEADAGHVLATAFVRTGIRESHRWCMATTRAYYSWAELKNPRVLSEGITEGGAS